jgi:hypothetical protein
MHIISNVCFSLSVALRVMSACFGFEIHISLTFQMHAALLVVPELTFQLSPYTKEI